ncbi:MAG TPA: ferritin family protein, partial [Bacteroidales bacterium]|nr:ferritin family protein [Bacteroidales bacterium]
GFLADVLSLFFTKKEPCLSKVGFYLMILGTLGAFAAYFTGEFFTRELTGEAGELKERHEVFAKITMFVMLAASLLRIYLVWKKKSNSGLKWVVFFLYLIATCTVGFTGLLGGTLVYNHMVGLESASVEQTVAVTNKTVDNLKTALQGETTASEKYAAFAKKAGEEGLPRIAALFDAASKAESVHAANHRNVLATLGHKVDVQPETFTVNNTLENLLAAYEGEKHETESMYPGFIEQAQTDNNNDAIKSFGWANDTEMKHMELYQAAADALKSGKEKTLPAEYYVCPKCGFTYSNEDIEDYCGLCGTEKSKFFVFGK